MEIRERPFQCQRDGLTLRGTELRPQGEGLPIAIVSHGFLGNGQGVLHYARWLARQGFCAYCFDFNGGGPVCASDGKMEDMTVGTEQADLEAVMAYARTRPYNNGADLTLMGCSQGGLVSALTAAKRPEAVRRLVLIFPALCIPDDARRGQLMMFRFDPAKIPRRLCAGPLTLSGAFPRYVMEMDVFREIFPYTGPVLLVHGTEDAVVDVAYARRAAEGYANARLRLIEGAGHGFNAAQDELALEAVGAFLHRGE